MKKILITGAKGFIGSNLVNNFKQKNYEIYGIGYNKSKYKNFKKSGVKKWISGEVSIKSILKLKKKFDIIIHCAGSGSVKFSKDKPYESFKRTVLSTIDVLEYIRVYSPNTHLIYPSSPASQGGTKKEKKIEEKFIGKPISQYGLHKKIVENLCKDYHKKYNLKITVVRLFSVYGNGLRKQIIWDTCRKFIKKKKEIFFYGSGNETRDFIHISDVISLFNILINVKKKFLVINGGSGKKTYVKNILNLVKININPNIIVKFSKHKINEDPNHMVANIKKLKNIGFKTKKKLDEGIKDYIKWFNNI